MDKFLGDAVMVVFRDEGHVTRALDAGLDVRYQLRKLAAQTGEGSPYALGVSMGIDGGNALGRDRLEGVRAARLYGARRGAAFGGGARDRGREKPGFRGRGDVRGDPGRFRPRTRTRRRVARRERRLQLARRAMPDPFQCLQAAEAATIDNLFKAAGRKAGTSTSAPASAGIREQGSVSPASRAGSS